MFKKLAGEISAYIIAGKLLIYDFHYTFTIRTRMWNFVFKLLFFLWPDLVLDKLHEIVMLIILHKKKNQYKIPNEVCFVSATFSFISFLEKA